MPKIEHLEYEIKYLRVVGDNDQPWVIW